MWFKAKPGGGESSIYEKKGFTFKAMCAEFLTQGLVIKAGMRTVGMVDVPAAAADYILAGGALYPEGPETPEARANLYLADAAKARDAGKHADGLAQCKRIFRLLKPGFPP